jgi:aminopeptidase N
MAQKETKRTAKAAAITKLGDYKFAKYTSLFKSALNDSSYTVAGNALEALSKIDSVAAYNEAKRLSAFPAKGKLATAITKTMIKSGDESSADIILSTFEDMPLSQAKFDMLPSLIEFLGKVKNTETLKRGVDDILAFESQFPESFREQASAYFNNMLRTVQKQKTSSGMKEQADYIESRLSAPKKDFTPAP